MFQKRKEMETFSLMLDKLLNGEDLDAHIEYLDDLPSKIRYQLLRLSEKMKEIKAQSEKERNEVRRRIAETAHQMRSPLANMKSYLELLENAESEKERAEYTKAAENAGEQLHFLTEGFIKTARLENHIIQIRREADALSHTIMQSILKVKKAADEKHIFIELDMDEKLETAHDANWLGEAVYNILENSVKYSPEGSVIHVSAIKNEMYTHIAVSDAGIGIEEGEEGKIFRRFYRGKKTNGQPGFGLGLYIAREIVLMHGGFVKAARKDPGLEISVFLP